MSLDTTVNKRGKKNITIRTGGNEKERCTVIRQMKENHRHILLRKGRRFQK
jgi:hypothetical protein